MKKFYLFLLTLISIEFFPISIYAQNNESTKELVKQNSMSLPSIRRIGIDTSKTNVDEFRSFMQKDDQLDKDQQLVKEMTLETVSTFKCK